MVSTSCSLVGGDAAAPEVRSCRSDQPAQRVLERVLGCAAAQQITIRLVADPPRPSGWFRVAGRAGAVEVQGSDASAALAGANWYLDHVVGASLTWAGSRLALPAVLPAPDRPIERSSAVPHRVVLNDTSGAYTDPYRPWPEWERQIDLLALHGYREVVVTEGQEVTYLDAFASLGWDRDELRRWIPRPAHVPWFLMGNLAGSGPAPSAELLDRRAELGRRIADRLRELGLVPVLPGYGGMVPPGAAERLAGARIVPQGTWNGTPRPDWLDPTSLAFPGVASAYYEAQRRRFGPTDMVRIDLLHEGGTLGPVPLAEAGLGVQAALAAALPDAVWALLGWQENPRRELLAVLDPARVLVLDGLSDTVFEVDRVADWGPAPHAFGTIPGFGGRTSLGANVGAWPTRFAAEVARSDGTLRGVAYLPEAAAGNALPFDLFAELAWTSGRIDLETWVGEWAANRYGDDPVTVGHARRAWQLLLDSVYGAPHGGRSQGADSLLSVRPGLYIGETVSLAQPLHYEPRQVLRALDELLAVPPAARAGDAYRADLADVTRQVIDDHARAVLARIAAAVRRRDPTTFRRRSADFSDLLGVAARLAAAHESTLLGPWLAHADELGADPTERAALRSDARRLLTTWGDRPLADGGLSDYAGRAWDGLVDGRYRPRWETFLVELATAVRTGGPTPARDWFAEDDAWVRTDRDLPTRPAGDLVAVALEVRDLVGG